MSYQVLARKWRPKSFATLIGQEHVVQALTHALDTGRLHHAWLFTGTRGVGKTTISRILAKALNCENGISSAPCGQCGACRAIDADRFADYVEMDAASNRGVDDMAALLNQAVYAPVAGRFKVYMIDEVHMLTGHAFNAMLKTLEEPPEHVKFILATTDPQKIPVTVLSRCLQFNLKQMAAPAICAHLENILTQEAVPFEASALRHIARAANGSMRDALSLLDQSIAHGAGTVREAQVTQMLGTVGEEHLYALLDALVAGDVPALVAEADAMLARSLSFASALADLARLLYRVALCQQAPQAIADEAERAALQRYASAWDAEFLQLAYQIVLHGQRDLPLAPDEYTGFTITLLRLNAFRPETVPPMNGAYTPSAPSAPSAENRPPAPEAALEATPAQEAEAPASNVLGAINCAPTRAGAADTNTGGDHTPEAPPAAEPPQGGRSPLGGQRVTAAQSAAGANVGVVHSPEPAAAVPEPASEAQPASAPSENPVLRALENQDWRTVETLLALTGQRAQLAGRCEWLRWQAPELHLRLHPDDRHLSEGTLPRELEELLAEHLGQPVRLRIELAAPQGETPHQRRRAEKSARLDAARQTLLDAPLVGQLMNDYGAALDERSLEVLARAKPSTSPTPEEPTP
ncbi:MAG: DNA polymerase III subunit gamma/tau [Rhodocyclaceae bacterium]|nr:DNA polymerase III subunit gamma/tau [Rhodocyclaceae bacterium]